MTENSDPIMSRCQWQPDELQHPDTTDQEFLPPIALAITQ